MIENRRHGNRWTINETLALQREGLIGSWREVKGFDAKKYQDSLDASTSTNDDNEEYQIVDNNCCDDNEETEIDTLTKRIWSLETNVDAISSMVKNIYSILSDNKSSKRKPLRNASA